MKQLRIVATLLLGCTFGCDKPAETGASAPEGADLSTRQEQLKTDIEFHLRDALDGRPVGVGVIEDSEVAGFDQSTFTIGQDSYPLLVSEDNKHLLLLAAQPFTNLGAEEMAAILAEEATAAAEHALLTAQKLSEETAKSPVRGNPNAPITIIEFSDFECPYCRRGYDTMQQVLDKYGDEVNWVYMHFPLGFHPWARSSAVATTCAANQSNDAFWTLHDYYFENQGSIEVDNVVARSRQALSGTGIDLNAWQECAAETGSDAHNAALAFIQSQMELGQESGVSGTPGFFVNGTFLNGAQPLAAFDRAIEDARQNL